MKLVIAFLKLIRWPNLFFIAITQWLFYFCVVFGLYPATLEGMSLFQKTIPFFYLLMFASVCIAAAGYIINDYFDRPIDHINKPSQVLIDNVFKRRWAMVWHMILSATGVLLSFYISYKTGKWVIGLANLCSVFLLWFYSTHFKKRLLIGNILIAALTAWVVVVVYFFAGATLLNFKGWNPANYPFNIKQFYKLTFLYAGFAFVVSLIREVIKDMEDILGDAQYKRRTMPIAWGIPATKVFTGVWIMVCTLSLAVVQLYAWQLGRWLWAFYTFTLIIIPMLLILKGLKKAKNAHDFHLLSNYTKWVMLAGILSMLFFKFIF